MSFSQQPHPYQAPPTDSFGPPPGESAAQKQSGLGIASFGIAIFAGVTAFALLVGAGMMEASNPGAVDEESPIAIVVGLGIFGVVGLSMLGIGLGVAGVLQPNRARAFGIIGLLFNIFVILGLIGIVVLGVMMTPV